MGRDDRQAGRQAQYQIESHTHRPPPPQKKNQKRSKPEYIAKAEEIKAKGVDAIYCIASNDAFVVRGSFLCVYLVDYNNLDEKAPKIRKFGRWDWGLGGVDEWVDWLVDRYWTVRSLLIAFPPLSPTPRHHRCHPCNDDRRFQTDARLGQVCV